MNKGYSQINKLSWEKYWAGNWSLLTACYFAHYYTKLMKRQLGVGMHAVVIISQKGYTSCYFSREDRKVFGQQRIKKLARTKNTLTAFCRLLKRKADDLIHFTENFKTEKIGKSQYNEYLNKFYYYTGLHITPRHLVDFMPARKLEKMLVPLEEARLYTEKVFKITEQFAHSFARAIGKKKKIPAHYILCMFPEEMEQYLETGILPAKSLLHKRNNGLAILFTASDRKVFFSDELTAVESLLSATNIKQGIRGASAHPGKVYGTVRIILNPHQYKIFKTGDILITGMTRPEFLPLIKKSAAVVTDAGGMLCHAAITARELKKPTIIGTGSATRFFKDGDRVEVDANKGIVKKL